MIVGIEKVKVFRTILKQKQTEIIYSGLIIFFVNVL